VTKETLDYVADTFEYDAGLSKVECRRLVHLCRLCHGRHCRQSWTCSTRLTGSKVGNFCRPSVERPFDVVVSVTRSTLSTKWTVSNSTLSPVWTGLYETNVSYLATHPNFAATSYIFFSRADTSYTAHSSPVIRPETVIIITGHVISSVHHVFTRFQTIQKLPAFSCCYKNPITTISSMEQEPKWLK